MVLDPNLKEEAASSGGLTVTLNLHGELCAVQKAKGIGLPAPEIMRCIRIAGQKVGVPGCRWVECAGGQGPRLVSPAGLLVFPWIRHVKRRACA